MLRCCQSSLRWYSLCSGKWLSLSRWNRRSRVLGNVRVRTITTFFSSSFASHDLTVMCTVPVTLVVLGAFFYTPPSTHPPFSGLHPNETPARPSNFFERKFRAIAGSHPSDQKAYPRENRTVFVAVISRMILVPMLMMPLLALMAKYDFFEAAADPVFVLCAVLLVSSVSFDSRFQVCFWVTFR